MLPEQILIGPKRVIFVSGPIKAGHAVKFASAGTAHPDVVAAFADKLIEAAATEEDVMSDNCIRRELIIEIVANCPGPGPDFYPVVSFAAKGLFSCLAAEDKVVAGASERLIKEVDAKDDEILAGPAYDQVRAWPGIDHVVAVASLDVVVATEVSDDVVSGAAVKDIVAGAALEPVSPPSP